MGKSKYYSLNDILTKNADYNLIIGERSNGKTYAVLKHCLECFYNGGGAFAYVRRWHDDIIGKRAETVFNALLDNNEIYKITGGTFSDIVYSRGRYYLANYDAEHKKMIAQKTPCCYAFSLSDTEHDKSTSYPDINNVVFDEFITRRYYLPDEFILFMNTLSTIIRDRNGVKIFMLGNTVNKYSPYFEEMGITNIATMEQGAIDVYTYGESSLTVAVEYCATSNTRKKSNKYFAFDNPKLNMITGGSWEISIYPHLSAGQKIKDKDIIYSIYVIFNKKLLQGDIVQNNDGLFLFFHNKTTPIKDPENSLIYSLDYTTAPNVRKSLLTGLTSIDKKIAWFFVANKVFYQSNEIGEMIRNYNNLSSR